MHFGNSASATYTYIKLYSVVISMLYCKQFSSFKARQLEKRYATVAFLTQLKVHVFNYMIITYKCRSIQSLDRDHLTQHKMAIPGFFTITTTKQQTGCLKDHLEPLVNKTCSKQIIIYIRTQEQLKEFCTPHMIRSTMVLRFCKLELP